jgi:hypothetical protein
MTRQGGPDASSVIGACGWSAVRLPYPRIVGQRPSSRSPSCCARLPAMSSAAANGGRSTIMIECFQRLGKPAGGQMKNPGVMRACGVTDSATPRAAVESPSPRRRQPGCCGSLIAGWRRSASWQAFAALSACLQAPAVARLLTRTPPGVSANAFSFRPRLCVGRGPRMVPMLNDG